MDVPATRPDLSVIVVTHNRAEMALRTLRSARSATGDIEVEWHVVDSGSAEPVADIIEREWHDIDVCRHVNAGFAAANNEALRRARGRYVLLLNPDVEVEQGTLAELVSALDQRPQVGMASVIQRAPGGRLQYSIRRDPRPLRAWAEALAPGRLAKSLGLSEEEARPAVYTRAWPADWLCGAFLIARAEAVAQIGPLDERFFLYSEETDWCYRCRQAGWDVLHLPMVTVTHHTSKAYAPALLAQLSYSRLLFARKHLSWRDAGALRCAVAMNHALRLAALIPAGVLRRRPSPRTQAERQALSVVLGHSATPFPRGDA